MSENAIIDPMKTDVYYCGDNPERSCHRRERDQHPSTRGDKPAPHSIVACQTYMLYVYFDHQICQTNLIGQVAVYPGMTTGHCFFLLHAPILIPMVTRGPNTSRGKAASRPQSIKHAPAPTFPSFRRSSPSKTGTGIAPRWGILATAQPCRGSAGIRDNPAGEYNQWKRRCWMGRAIYWSWAIVKPALATARGAYVAQYQK